MQGALNPPQLLDLPVELHVKCFYALGPLGGSLDDSFQLAETCKTLYAVYKRYRFQIASHLIASSSIYSYDVLLCKMLRLQATLLERVSTSETYSPELRRQNERDLSEYKVSHNLKTEDVYKIAARWQSSVCDSSLAVRYLKDMNDYQRSPFPYRWGVDLKSSIVEDVDSSTMSRDSETFSQSFKDQFHKARIRYWLSQVALRIVHLIPFDDNDKHWDWARQFWHGDNESSFLEFLQALEVRDYVFGFASWTVSLPNRPLRCDLGKFVDILDSMWPDRQEGVIVYPDLADRRLDVPISLDGLLTRQGVSEDEKNNLLQAWFRFREKWPQTGRCTVWSLKSSEDAYATLRDWTERNQLPTPPLSILHDEMIP